MRFALSTGTVIAAALLAACPTPPPGGASNNGPAPRDLRAAADQAAAEPPAGDAASPGDGAAAQTCGDVVKAFEALVSDPAHKSCGGEKDCQVLAGPCGKGLGGCHYALNLSVSSEALSALGDRYEQLGCTGAVCRCMAPPPVTCQRGVCALVQ